MLFQNIIFIFSPFKFHTMKKILIFLLIGFSSLSVWSQIDFKKASKEDVGKYYLSLPKSSLLTDIRASTNLNPDIKITDLDSATEVFANGKLIYREVWTLSLYTQDIRSTSVYHGFVGPSKTYVLMISANRSRGHIFIKEANNYLDICGEDIAWIRGKLFEVKDLNNDQIIVKILQAPSRNLDPSYLVIDLKTKKPEVFD